MLTLHQIHKSYGKTKILHGVDLEVSRGCCLCLAGANACGKTTLLSIAAGTAKADSGSVHCQGRLGYVPQDNALLEDLSVQDNLRLWYSAFDKAASDVFAAGSPEDQMGLLPHRKKRVSSLSGGIKKRLSIATALVSQPDCLIMDEPFTALDLAAKEEIMAIVTRLKKSGKTILFSSHDPLEIATICDVLAVMNQGTIAATAQLEHAGPEEIRRIIFSHFN